MKTLETERLILRNWKLSDSKDLFEYAKSELVGPNAGWQPHKNEDESIKIIEKFINDDDVYAIELKSENKVIGSVGIHKRFPDDKLKEPNQREIGYVLSPKYWGNGYVPEAVKKVIDYCFEDMKLDIIWCGHFDFNDKSKRVIEKCGFEYKFSKEELLERLDNKKVTILFYNKVNEDR